MNDKLKLGSIIEVMTSNPPEVGGDTSWWVAIVTDVNRTGGHAHAFSPFECYTERVQLDLYARNQTVHRVQWRPIGQQESEGSGQGKAQAGVGIGEVIAHLEGGGRAWRLGWSGNLIFYVAPAEESSLPYLKMLTAQGKHVPWLCSQEDILARDWVLESKL